jgi:general secretion pathway protein L
MSVLRVFCALPEAPQRCHWMLTDAGDASGADQGSLDQLPQGADRVELVVPATQVLLTRSRLPPSRGRRAGSLLAYAVEDSTATAPELNQVIWLGLADGEDVLAVVDRPALQRWRDALGAVGIHVDAVYCETLMLPLPTGGWSIAWDGREGFVRTGPLEGAATDCGDRESPPLSLQLMLEAARARDAAPACLALFVATPDAAPDVPVWEAALGVRLLPVQHWDWRQTPSADCISLVPEPRRWQLPPGSLARLRPVAWIAGIALLFHAAALIVDWARLSSEQQRLHQQMDARFRSTFPDAVAVADAAVQMRRKLAEARHAANQPDAGDFPVMVAAVGTALAGLPAGAVRLLAYAPGRMTVQILVQDAVLVRQVSARLAQAGLRVEASPPAAGPGGNVVTLTVSAT